MVSDDQKESLGPRMKQVAHISDWDKPLRIEVSSDHKLKREQEQRAFGLPEAEGIRMTGNLTIINFNFLVLDEIHWVWIYQISMK